MRPRNIINVCAAFIFVTAVATAMTADPAGAQTVSRPSSASVSPNLSDLPTAHWAQGQNLKMVPAPRPLPPRGAGPGGAPQQDGALQHEEGPHLPVNSKTKFGGIGASGYIPPDPNIAVGLNHIVQMVNSQLAVFNKSGAMLTGPVALNTLWTSLGGACAGSNAGDPVVQYDVAADRWLVTQLGSTTGPTYSECIAVSATNDPSGSYNLYAYDFGTSLNDYPKFGVWRRQFPAFGPRRPNPAHGRDAGSFLELRNQQQPAPLSTERRFYDPDRDIEPGGARYRGSPVHPGLQWRGLHRSAEQPETRFTRRPPHVPARLSYVRRPCLDGRQPFGGCRVERRRALV
jgi:hypothetical protein